MTADMTSTQNDKKFFPYYFIIKIVLSLILFFTVINVENIENKKWAWQLITGLWAFLIPSIIVSIIRFIIIAFYKARHAKKSVRGNFVLGINRLTAVLNAVFFIIAIMIGAGINPVTFLTSMTIVAMAIAVTFRDYITNMLSGLFIMFSDQLSIGDKIKVGGNKGMVEDITLSNIVLKNEEEDIVLVPNNVFFTQPLVNLSALRSKLLTLKFELPLSEAAHMQALEKELQSVFNTHPDVEPGNELQLRVQELGKDFVKFSIELIARSSSDKLHRKIEAEILKQILLFKDHTDTLV